MASGSTGDLIDFDFNKEIRGVDFRLNSNKVFEVQGYSGTSFGLVNVEDTSSTPPSQSDYEGIIGVAFGDGSSIVVEFQIV